MGAGYVYATARVRSLESKLIKGEQFQKMTETKSIDEILKVLQDAGYSTESDDIKIDNYQECLKKAEKDLHEEMRTLSEEEEIFNIFCYQADYHNIKTLIKAESLGIDRRDILMDNGTIPADVMAECVQERKKMALTENMGKALDEAVDGHARTGDPQLIDFICDRYCFMDIVKAAEESKNDFVQGYVKLWIDTINLKTMVRVKKMKQPWTYFRDVFIPGGEVSIKAFAGAYDEDLKQAAVKFTAYAISEAMETGGADYEETGNFTLLEKLCDDALIRYIRDAKAVSFGAEPLVAFLIAREMEIKCIRILMSGKLAGMEPAVIRERMRETYE